MGAPLVRAALFLIDILFSLYILAVLLRFLFQLVRADFYNPFSQALVKITNPTLLPLRRMIPGLYGLDMGAVALLLILECLKNYLLLLVVGRSPNIAGLLLFSVAGLLELTLYVFIVTTFARVILSWFVPYGYHNPVLGLLRSLTEPLLRPARRLVPPISGLDLSPIGVFILLYLTLIIAVQPLKSVGAGLLG
jgi:YggT family protein